MNVTTVANQLELCLHERTQMVASAACAPEQKFYFPCFSLMTYRSLTYSVNSNIVCIISEKSR